MKSNMNPIMSPGWKPALASRSWSACNAGSVPRKQHNPSKYRPRFMLEIPKQMEDNKDVTKNR
jgi:hypothetical protein